jgi:hypothetical protein
MSNFTAYQDIECVYPMSGQYGRAPRALYYSLLLFVILFRRQDWLTAGAAAFCLTFGGSAAIHAMILAPILSLGKPPNGILNGIITLSNSTNVKITPLATDLDSDATLAVVGTGFLIVVPMALWSVQFRHSGAVPVLVLWICLMFVGMICCVTNLYAINGSASGPLRQFRFCSSGYNGSLPYSSSAAVPINDSWNDTVWTYFNTPGSAPSCIYPCLSATEVLRQQGDVRAIQFLAIAPPNPLFWGLDIVSAVIFGCVPLTMFFTVLILILRLQGSRSHSSKSKIRTIGIWAVNVYGKILIPFVFGVFLVWAEWIIAYDVQSEEMQLVGQWAPLVGAGLVFVAAIVGKYWPRFSRLWVRFWVRRTELSDVGLKEGILESVSVAWWSRDKAWTQEGAVFLQSSD